MEMYGNEIKVHQGEDWNMDFLLSANQVEYIPFIISNKRKNPFFVVTVASTKYEKNNRYVKSWWNDILNPHNENDKPIPTFYQTTPYYIGEYNSTDELPNIPTTETYETRLLYQYTLSTDEVDNELGHKPYYYYYFNYEPVEQEDGMVQMVPNERVDEYECHIRFNFSSDDTGEWSGQEYLYQITLVSGELIEKVLSSIAFEHGMPEDWPSDIKSQYQYVKTIWPNELQSDIDVTSPLGYIENTEVIVPPTKIEVFNNLRRLI